MLLAHMDAMERTLLAHSQVPANSGHPVNKGTPREVFIREFLESHLPSNVAIGTGEIIDSNSKPNEPRNQFDIVVYRKNYPKLDFGGGISGFLIESVIATIEVKSTLNQVDMLQAVKAARASKELVPNFISSFSTGYVPPKILNYVVAYNGPAMMETVFNWIPTIHGQLGILVPELPLDPNLRTQVSAPSIDGVFVLNKGFVYFDNVPFGFANGDARSQNPQIRYVFSDTVSGNLLLLFLYLQGATANIEGRWLNAIPYITNLKLKSFTCAPA